MKNNSENGRSICKSHMELEVNVKIYKEILQFNKKTGNTSWKLTRNLYKYFSKKDWKMTNLHIKKKGSVQLVIREMKILNHNDIPIHNCKNKQRQKINLPLISIILLFHCTSAFFFIYNPIFFLTNFFLTNGSYDLKLSHWSDDYLYWLFPFFFFSHCTKFIASIC